LGEPDKHTARWSIAAPPYPTPALRRLRVYAVDPQASSDLNIAQINDSVIELPWETPWELPLKPGPCGEYIEVIDHDPASGLYYEPIDLNAPELLAQNGLPPSEGRPQFHQQMVYAVAMKTILDFERALGRHVFFAREYLPGEKRGDDQVQRLRIYPHAMRHDNAYYSPIKTALLFGYFQPDNHLTSGDRWVFTCLSQDIVAHETAHAILHGVHRRSIQPSNLDTRAFHEGFADIVALLQHFTMRDVLRQQIRATRGSVRRQSLLNSLAGQFGHALGRKTGALRFALELVELDGAIARADSDADKITLIRQHWERLERGYKGSKPAPTAALDPALWEALLCSVRLGDSVTHPHERGGYLVAAVYDAFAMIYERRTADLMRINAAASRGTEGDLLPDIVERLATEATKAADHVMRMCVRALDYVPPVDMTFGEYLRAIITADHDLVPNDPHCYRIAMAQAFRRRGIVPESSLSMAPDSLLWEAPDPEDIPKGDWDDFADLLPRLQFALDYRTFLEEYSGKNFREANAKIISENQAVVHGWLTGPPYENDGLWGRLLGIELFPATGPERASAAVPKIKGSIPVKDKPKQSRERVPVVEVYSARIARRAGPDGQELSQLIIQVTQRRRGYFSAAKQAEVDAGDWDDQGPEPDFWFRGGATLLIDLRDGRLRYAIRKSINNDERLERQRAFEMRQRFAPSAMQDDIEQAAQMVYSGRHDDPELEPFAMVHRGQP
jgi:hypothetical protein